MSVKSDAICDGNIVGFMCSVVQSYAEWRR